MKRPVSSHGSRHPVENVFMHEFEIFIGSYSCMLNSITPTYTASKVKHRKTDQTSAPGCQMVYFMAFGIFYGHLVYFMARWYTFKWHMVCFTVFWYILWSFGIFYGHLVYFMVIWYILRSFGIFYRRQLVFITLPPVVGHFQLVLRVELWPQEMRRVPSGEGDEPLFKTSITSCRIL
jgi:hypothetical protein